MASFGFQWSQPPPAPTAVDTEILGSRRYGVTDLADAQRYGYQVPFNQSEQPGPIPTAEESTALIGPRTKDKTAAGPAVINGKTVPADGCQGEASRAIGADISTSAVQSIAAESWTDAQHDSRVGKAFETWSACMSAQGYHYASPINAMNALTWSTPPSDLERRTAVADVTCATSTGLDHTWSQVEAALERPMIAQNLPELTREASNVAAGVSRAENVLKTAGLEPTR
jgi:hypothetical protein